MRIGLPRDFADYLARRGTSPADGDAEGHLPLTLRAVGVGSFLSLFLAVAANYSDIVIKGSFLTFDFSTPAALFLFLFTVGILNTLFKLTARTPRICTLLAALAAVGYLAHYYPFGGMVLYSPGLLFSSFLVATLTANAVLAGMGGSLALNRSELIVVYLMLITVSSLATAGLCEAILPVITGAFYYATPENRWAEILFPALPRQIMVDDGNSNRLFYEGFGTSSFDVPYGPWLQPMLMWGIFLLALYVAMVSLAVILRRQWMERERLAYPLVQAAQEIVRGEQESRLVNPFFRSGSMWCGAAVPMLVGLFTGLGRYVQGWPQFTTEWIFPLLGGQFLNMTVSFAVLGFSYLIGTNIALGIWAFALLAKVERMAFATMGVTSKQELWAVTESELVNYQGLGALLVFVLMGLWVGREHLMQVVRKFAGLPSELADDDEIISYRAAVLGCLVGTAVMSLWLWHLGMPLWTALLFVLLALAIFVGLSRVVAQAGVCAIISPMVAPDFMIYGIGSKLIGTKGIATMSMSYVFATDIRVFLMGLVANGLKLVEEMDRHARRYVFWAILIAIFLGIAGSLYTVMNLAYRDGGINSNTWFFIDFPKIVYATVVSGMEPRGIYWEGLGFAGLGGLGMLAFTWFHHRFHWWPLHPIGFPIMASWIVDWMWFSVFLAWFFKLIVLRFGGATLFARSRHFFLGIIAGRMLITGAWVVVDYFTGKVGNSIFWI